MKVAQVMSVPPVTVHAGTGVGAALRLLASHHITMLPVVDRRGRILGVVAEGDLLGRDLGRDLTRDAMHRTTFLAHPESDVVEVARLLRDTGLKSLPVVDAADQVVGVVSRSDVVRMLARDDAELQEAVVDALCRAGAPHWRAEVHNGVVDLSGPEDETPERALSAVQGTLGIRDVRVR